MTEMTKRLIEAIENPHTTMIGHISGRLLLARDPYLFDKMKVVDAAIANKVVIEFNANPHRLDFDWRDLAEACQRGLLVSLNPDAHSREGLQDIRYGLWFANKARIPHELILNTWDTEQLKSFFSKK
jgi:DNA polymerase (family 10)